MVDQESLGKVNELLSQVASMLGWKIKMAVVQKDQLEFLEKNARYMTNEMFRRLVENIKNDGQLSSVPLCIRNGEKYRVLSGNHRLKAGIEAGQERFLVMYIDWEESKSKQIARQLSHNAIQGQDDTAILKELYEEIEGIEEKLYAGLDDKTLETLETVSLDALSEVNLEFRSVAFVLLPEEHERLDEVLLSALKEVKAKNIYLGMAKDYDRLVTSIGEVQDSYSIKNVATALTGILDVFEKNREDLQEGFMQNDPGNARSQVPVSTVFGTDRLNEVYAITIIKAIKKAVKAGAIKEGNPWELLYQAAQKYLGE